MRQCPVLLCVLLANILVCRNVAAGDKTTTDITTSDGKTYRNASVQRVEPDGIVYSYRTEGGGIGVAKVRFAVLPQDLQREYGHDAQKAAMYASAPAHQKWIPATVALSERAATANAPKDQGPKGQALSGQKPAELPSNIVSHIEETEIGAPMLVPPLPSEVTTTDGKTHKGVKLLQVEPDGLAVTFQPAAGGIGMAKLKFRNLSESFQRQYGYNMQKAAAYEAEREAAMKRAQAKMWAEFKIQCAAAAKYRQENEKEMARREAERIRQEQERIFKENERKRAEEEAARLAGEEAARFAGEESVGWGADFYADGLPCLPDAKRYSRGGPVQVSRGFRSTMLPAVVSNDEINAAYRRLALPPAPVGKK